MAGVNLFDLAARITADTKGAEQSLTTTQQKVLNLAKEFSHLDTKATQSGQKIAHAANQINTASSKAIPKASGLNAVLQNLSSTTVAMQGPLGGVAGRLEGLQALLGQVSSGSVSAGGAMAGMAGPIGIAAAGIVAMTVAVGALLKQLVDLGVQTADWQGKLFDMSQQVGVSVEMLSGLEVVAATTGGNLDTMAQSLVVFQGKMVEAGDATSTTGKLFKELGITSGETDEALRQAITGLAKMGEGYKQTNAAAEVFGRRGAKAFLAITKETSGDLDRLIEKLRAMGVLLSGDAAKSADEFNDQLAILQYQARAVGAAIGQQMLPPILGGLKSLSNLLTENQSAIQLMGSAVRFLIAQPLEAWLRGNFYWLNQLGDALNYVTSRTWSIKYEVVMIGGMPIPVPGGLIGTPKPDIGHAAGGRLGKEPRLGGGGGGGGGRGGGGRAVDEVAEALKRQQIEIDNAILGTDRYDQEINRLIESLKKKKQTIDEDRLAQLRANADTIRATLAGNDYREFMQSLKEELFDATHQTDEWDKALRSQEKQLAKNKATLKDFVGAEHEDIIAKLRLIELLKKEAQAMQELNITRQRYADILRNTRPRMVGVPENEDVYIDEAGRVIDRRPKGVTPEQDADRTRPRRALPDPWMEQYEKMRGLAESLTDLISDSLTVGFQKGMKAGLAEFALGILQMIQAKILNKLTDAITDALMKGFGNAQGGSGKGGIFASIFGAVLGGLGGIFGGGGGGAVGGLGRAGAAGAGGGMIKLARGMDFVPFDNFPALLHRGERVVTAEQNAAGGGSIVVNMTVVTPNAQSFAGRDTQTQISRNMQNVMKQAVVRVS